MSIVDTVRNFILSQKKSDGIPDKKANIKGGVSYTAGGISFDRMRINLNTYYNLYKTHGDIYACIRELRQGVGAAGYQWIDNKGDPIVNQNTKDLDRIFGNSQLQSWKKLLQMTVRDLALVDNCFWHIVPSQNGRDIAGFQRLDPRSVRQVVTSTGVVVKYIQQIGGSEAIDFDPLEIVHFYQDPDPDNEVFGLPPLETMIWDALADIEAAKSNYAFFENSAQPGAWYMLEDGISEEEQEKLIDSIKANLGGSKNRYKATILSGVKDIKTLQLSQREMEYIPGRRFSTEKICSLYGVPKFLLGYTDTVNNNNASELLHKYYNNTLIPQENFISEVVNIMLMPRLGLDYAMQFLPQDFESASTKEVRRMQEVRLGIISRRQYKMETGRSISKEDERNPNFDILTTGEGSQAILLEDVGIDPNPIAANENTPQ